MFLLKRLIDNKTAIWYSRVRESGKWKSGAESKHQPRILCDYSRFIDLVQTYSREGSELKDAIREASKECEKRRIMLLVLKEHISEVENMLNVEWNLEDALQVEREEGREEGIDIGIKQSVQSLSRFFPADQIAQMLEIPLNQVNLSLENPR